MRASDAAAPWPMRRARSENGPRSSLTNTCRVIPNPAHPGLDLVGLGHGAGLDLAVLVELSARAVLRQA